MAHPKLFGYGWARVAGFNLPLPRGIAHLQKWGTSLLNSIMCPQLARKQDFHVEGEMELISVYGSLLTVYLKKKKKSL